MKRLVDLDVQALDRTQQILGTTTMKATVNAALREVVRRHTVIEFVDLAARGTFGTRPDQP